MKVRDIMTINVITVPESAEIEEAARLLAYHRISGLPVTDDHGALSGLVTEFDFITKTGTSVADIMTRGVVSVSPDTEIEELIHLLTNQRIRRVPVVEGNRLVGIVSRSDLIKQIAMRWICHICGDVVSSLKVPEQCPSCGAPSSAFRQGTPPPGV